MKRTRLIALILLLSASFIHAADVWQTEVMDSTYGTVRGCDMAVDSNDYPVAAYSADSYGVNYLHWDGTEYDLDGVTGDSDLVNNLALDIDVNDNPYVATSNSDNHYLYCLWWDGSDWQEDCVYSYRAGAPGDIKVFNGEDARISFQRIPGSGDAGDLCLASQSSGSWAVGILDSNISVGWYSKYFGGGISHYDEPNHSLKCYSGGTSRTVDNSDQYDGNPSDIASWNSTYGIAYLGGSSSSWDLKYAEGSGSTWAIETVEADCRPNNIAIVGMHNATHTYIVYTDRSTYTAPILKCATRDGSGGSWSVETLATGSTGDFDFLDMELDSDDYPHLVYVNGHDIVHTWLGSDAAVEVVSFEARPTDEAEVMLRWSIVGDEPASVSVLRSVSENQPITLSGELSGSATSWLDASAKAGVEYAYYLEVTELDGTVSRFGPSEVIVPNAASELTLSDSYPNPAGSALTISYELATDGAVSLSVYDLSGRLVETLVSGEQTAGRHSVNWDSSVAATGVYLLRLEAEGNAITRRAVISR